MGKEKYVIKLLIVPYGIETNLVAERSTLVKLLIVPYGIETVVDVSSGRNFLLSFNRTLWN